MVIEIIKDELNGFGVNENVIDGDDKKDILNIGVDIKDKKLFKNNFKW